MNNKAIKEEDCSKYNIIHKGKSNIFANVHEKEKANNDLIKINNSFSKGSDLKEKQNNSLIKRNSILSKNIDLKEKPNNICSSSEENKKNKSKKKNTHYFFVFSSFFANYWYSIDNRPLSVRLV